MSRAERIAERIREKAYEVPNKNDFDRGAEFALNELAKGFEAGCFDDILGPEVTADVVADLRWFFDGTDLWDLAHDEIRMGGNVDSAMRYRRLAKWLQQLERSAQRG